MQRGSENANKIEAQHEAKNKLYAKAMAEVRIAAEGKKNKRF